MTLADDLSIAPVTLRAGIGDLSPRRNAAWTPPTLIVTADPEHGVTTYARQLAEQVRLVLPHTAVRGPRLEVSPIGAPGWVHVHFTDRLWGADALSAAAAVEALAADYRVIVTLHDVPQYSDGTNLARRAECYRRVIAAAAAVVCNSEHEAELLREFTSAHAAPAVIPLPVQTTAPLPVPEHLDGAVAILGFVYPGKGHERAIDAASLVAVRPGVVHGRPRVVALGRASAGHEGDVDALRVSAHERGVSFEVTGYLSDDELVRRARHVSVPVIAHDHVSASGSLASWISAGRRPIVVRSRYMEEMAALRPGTVTLVDAVDFVDAVAAALQNPESTWLHSAVDVRPTTRDTVDQYLEYWQAVMSA